MKKFVVKTTKEFTYDEKGYITKEVVTEESYETEVHTGGKITSGTISAKEISVDGINGDKIYTKVTGDNPTTTVVSKTVGDITSEVKTILERELRKRNTLY